MAGNLELGNKLASMDCALQDALLVWEKTALAHIGKVHYEFFELEAVNSAVALLIILLPGIDKVINIALIDRHLVSIGLSHERVNDNSNEEIQEDLRHHHIERVEEKHRNVWVSA